MSDFVDGSVVIVGSGQSGTLMQIDGPIVWVLLKNLNIWHGPIHQIRLPQDQADLDACPLEVERTTTKVIIKPRQ